MGDPMRVRALERGGETEIKVLMRHDMETGLRKDAAGKLIPAHFIQYFAVRHKDHEVINAQFGPSISKNPFVGFKFKGGTKGDKITVTWTDNLGDSRTDEVEITSAT
jgi:sulfur-oxidizing protein SoxZ